MLMAFNDHQLKDIGVTRSDVVFALLKKRVPHED